MQDKPLQLTKYTMQKIIVLLYGLTAVLLSTPLMVESHNFSTSSSSSSKGVTTDQHADLLVVQNHELLNPFRFLNEEKEDERRQDHPPSEKPWGQVLLATLIVNLATLTGVIFLIPALSRNGCFCCPRNSEEKDNLVGVVEDGGEAAEEHKEDKIHTNSARKYVDMIIPSFAAGALLSTIVFLVLPEGLMALQKAVNKEEEGGDASVVEGEHEEHHEDELAVGAIWRFGTMLLAGFLLPVIFEAMFPHDLEDTVEQVSNCDCCSLNNEGESTSIHIKNCYLEFFRTFSELKMIFLSSRNES